MIQTADELVDILQSELQSLARLITDDNYERVVITATSELGWQFPISEDRKEFWIVQRAKRHAFFILWSDSASKFKYKQAHLNQRFDHYGKIIEKMDLEYLHALENEPELFLDIAERVKYFGYVVEAGFNYDIVGRDITHRTKQKHASFIPRNNR